MRWLKLVYVVSGLGLLAWILAGVDLGLAWNSLLGIGWGLIAVLAVYLLGFYVDSLSWQLAISRLPLTLIWSYRVWRIRMVGEAFNTVMPAGGFGGEPVKAVLLKRHHAVDYRDGTTSLILARTINLIALIGFMSIGLILMADHGKIPDKYTWLAMGGFAFLSAGIGFLLVVQRFGGASLMGVGLRHAGFGASLDRAIETVRDVEGRLGKFYARTPARFFPALLLAMVNWIIGALETYVILSLLGHPVSFADAWIIESVAQMVRAVTFFVPANLGTLDSVFIVLCGAITGHAEIGVAVAAVKRIRELIFVLWGFGLGSLYSLRNLMADAEKNELVGDTKPGTGGNPASGPDS